MTESKIIAGLKDAIAREHRRTAFDEAADMVEEVARLHEFRSALCAEALMRLAKELRGKE